MKHKIAVFLFVIFPIASCDLDFSQFYLPPCCHISSQGSDYTGYASASNLASVNTKREVDLQTSTRNAAGIKNLKVHQSFVNKTANEKSEYSKKLKKSSKSHEKFKIYRIIVPLDEILVKSLYQSSPVLQKETGPSSTTVRSETSLKPPTMGKILVPEMKNDSQDMSKFKRNSNRIMSRAQLLEEVITSELEGAESQRSYTGKKSLIYDDEIHLKPEHREVLVESESKSSPSQYKLVSQERGSVTVGNSGVITDSTSFSNTVVTNTSSGNPVKRQANRKVPSTWLTNLQRALYQSLTAVDRTQVDGGSENLKDLNNLSKETIRFPETWKNIKAAQVQYVNKMAQVSSGPYQIFLPRGEGPVASGVLVNTRNVGLQIRVATELHQRNNNQQSACSCYLLNHGEIPVAYWAVTRVLNQKNRAALQYLVHPLPHSVPTPPQMFPMGTDPMFDPSPVDPFTNFYENRNRQQMQQLGPSSQLGNHIDGDFENAPPSYPPPQQFFEGPRHPKFIHELPNGHHRIEIYDDSFRPQPSPMPPGFTSEIPQQPAPIHQHPFTGQSHHEQPLSPQNLQSVFQHGPPIQQADFQQGPPIPAQADFQQGPPPPPQQIQSQQGLGPGPVPYVNNDNEQVFLPPDAPSPTNVPISDLELYRNIAQNNFQNPSNQITINQNNLLSGSPYDGVNVLNPQHPVSQAPAPEPFQGFLPPIPPSPTQFVTPINQAQQQPLNPTNPGPTQFTRLAGDNQLSKPPTFPKSIQEILSPYALSPNLPQQGQFVTNQKFQSNQQQEGLQNDLQNNLAQQIKPNNNNEQDNSKDSGEDVTGGDPYPPSSFHSTQTPYFNNEDKDNSGRNRPYIVSNVLDNEKKYYPVRKPYKVAYSKDYYVRRPAYHRRRPIHSRYQHIDDKRGYILNF